jgi:nucleoside-diphosphate-sugar epimerase
MSPSKPHPASVPLRLKDTAERDDFIISRNEPILVTGAGGFVGSRLVACLLAKGFRHVRCFVRSSVSAGKVEMMLPPQDDEVHVEVIQGNLLSREDCEAAVKDVAVIYHLAAEGGKSFPGVFMNCVVTTRNLLEAASTQRSLRRFVNTGSFAVYSNRNKPRRNVLDESCPVEDQPALRADAYCFAKLKQDELVMEYSRRSGIKYVIVRPGVVYGAGKERIPGRVGLDTFGVFLHLGGSNPVPFTYVDNCAEAIALAGLMKGVDGEIFNVVDDDLPSSREFLRMYKKNVRRIRSVYVPHVASYLLCFLWERYSGWSQGQLPPIHNRREWSAYWKPTRYSNAKLKRMLGWEPGVPTREALKSFLASCKHKESHA